MTDARLSMIKGFQNQGYLLFSTRRLDQIVPGTCELVSHDDATVIGPDQEEVAFSGLLRAGALIDNRYNEGAVALLGKSVAHRTQGRFPERWVGVSTGQRAVDIDTIQRTASYALSTFGHLIDPVDAAALSCDSITSMHDLFDVSVKLQKCLMEIAESEDHPQLGSWLLSVQSVVENFTRGVHVPRVNLPLRYDNGSMLVLMKEISVGACAYIGTKHGIPFADIREKFEMGLSLEANLNLVRAVPGTWFRVHQGQPFKATAGVMAELVMRDGQASAQLLGANVYRALTDEAVVGPERVKKQKLGPSGPVNDFARTWRMRAGKLYLRGVEFVDREAQPFSHKEKDKYRHMRVTEGAVDLMINDTTERLEDGDSALILPGVAFMVGAVANTIPSSYIVSTLTNLGPRQTV